MGISLLDQIDIFHIDLVNSAVTNDTFGLYYNLQYNIIYCIQWLKYFICYIMNHQYIIKIHTII